jgi:thioredoxin 1
MKSLKNYSFFMLILLFSISLSSCKKRSSEVQQNDDQIVTEILKPTPTSVANSGTDLKEDLSGTVQIITEEQFIQKITEINDSKGFQYKGKTPAIVDFYADWCRPCVALSPVMEELAAKYKGKIIIYKVNVDRARNVSTAFGIESIPTLMFLKMNTQPGMIVGAPRKADLEKKINEILL